MPYIDELERSMDELIQEQAENSEYIPNNADIFSGYVRQCIDAVLEQAKMKKEEVFQSIKHKIGNDVVNPFSELDSIDAQIKRTEEELLHYSTAKEGYETRLNGTTDYGIFTKYFESAKEKKKKKKEANQQTQEEENLPEYQSVLRTARRESEIIRNKVKDGNMLCMFITLICMIFDAIMLYQPFAGGNQASKEMTILITVIAAFTLDALPTMFGIVSAQIKNTQKMVSIKQAISLPVDSERRDLFRSYISYFIVSVLTIFGIAVYIGLRIVLLAGGGDFSKGIQVLLSDSMETVRERLAANKPSFSDGFSILPPFATSLFCFLFSMFKTPIETDFMDAFNLRMKEKLQQAKEKCAEQEQILEKEQKSNTKNKEEVKFSIWSRYRSGKPPETLEDFKSIITAEALALETKKYLGEYESFCSQARSCTEVKIHAIKAKLSGNCADPKKIVQLSTTADEQEKLNYIWSTDGNQLDQTLKHKDTLDESIGDSIRKWTSAHDDDGVKFMV